MVGFSGIRKALGHVDDVHPPASKPLDHALPPERTGARNIDEAAGSDAIVKGGGTHEARKAAMGMPEPPLMELIKGAKGQEILGIRSLDGKSIYMMSRELNLDVTKAETIGIMLRGVRRGTIKPTTISHGFPMKERVPDLSPKHPRGFKPVRGEDSRGNIQDIVIESKLGTLRGEQTGTFTEKLSTGRIRQTPIYEFYKFESPKK